MQEIKLSNNSTPKPKLTGLYTVEWPDGGKGWYKDGKLHRMDGPAYCPAKDPAQFEDKPIWCIEDHRYNSNAGYQKDSGISNEDMFAMILTYGDVK